MEKVELRKKTSGLDVQVDEEWHDPVWGLDLNAQSGVFAEQ
jgi:hypothetical protein